MINAIHALFLHVESGQTKETLPRDIVARELHIPPDDNNL